MLQLAIRARLPVAYALSLVFLLSLMFFIALHKYEAPAESSITDGANAVDVLGQYDQTNFTSPVGSYTKNGINDGPNIFGFNSPGGSAIDTVHHRFFLVDIGNHRVVVYDLNADNTFIDRIPDHGLGQANFASNFSGVTQSKLYFPQDIAYDSTNDRLFVADRANNRVLLFDVASITDDENAINVLGQTNFTTNTATATQSGMSWPYAIEYDSSGQKLYVADGRNNRVLLFDVASITDGENAINVLGQPDFVTATSNATQFGMDSPRGLAFDSTGNRLFVADYTNNRVLVFDVASITDGENAINVVGQSNFITSTGTCAQNRLYSPVGLDYDSARNYLFVNDYVCSRVIIFDVASISDGEIAVKLLGKTGYTDMSGYISQSGFMHTQSSTYDSVYKRLYVADDDNSRIMVFDLTAITNGENAVDALGQYDETSFTNPQVTYLKRWENNGPNKFGYENPQGGVFDTVHHRFFISDAGNRRVLVYNLNSDMTFPDKVPDHVLGQNTFLNHDTNTTQSTLNSPKSLAYDSVLDRLFVADYYFDRVMVFDTTTIVDGENAINVLGQANFTTNDNSVTNSRMNSVSAVAYSSATNRLFVADSANNRVLVFDVATITNSEAAINVLGQSDFSTAAHAAAQNSLYSPSGLAYNNVSNLLYVSDSRNHRVVAFDVASISDGENAIKVLGQSNFTSGNSGFPVRQWNMDTPAGITYDDSNRRLYVADSGNNRVTVFDVVSITDGENAINVVGQTGFTTETYSTTQSTLYNPNGVVFESVNRKLYVMDSDNNRAVVFDDRTVGFSVSASSVSVSEGGGSESVSVQLTGTPVSDVVIDVSSSDTGAATVSPASLTFTPGNWNTPQTLTITPVVDADIANETVTATLSINDASSDN